MIRTIDFDTLATGETVTDQFAELGVQVSASANGSGVDQAIIFDTNAPTGDDEDLATTNLNNVLIISEDGDSADPDDNASGGVFTFDFDDAVQITSLTFLDIEADATLRFFDADGELISTQTVAAVGDNNQAVAQVSVPGTARLEVELQGSGAIDNLVFEDNVDDPADTAGDGIVSGDDTGNIIDLAFTGDPDGDMVDAGDALIAGEAPDDDIVDALGGDDFVTSLEGDDDVYAGAGDDTVFGGAGDDLIFGDRTLAGDDDTTTTIEGGRESFNFSEEGFANGDPVTEFTQNTGTVDVTFRVESQTPKTTTAFSTQEQTVEGIDGGDETVSTTSSLSSETRAAGQSNLYSLNFSTAVTGVDFNINDIDGDGFVTVLAFDENNNPVEVTLVGGDRLTLSDTNATPGNDTAASDGSFADATNPTISLQVDIAGPVSRIEILQEQIGAGNTEINITDVFFNTGDVVVSDESNDDLLFGEAGMDTIFGETGEDTITGGEGADSLSGGDDADTFIGGTDGDVIDGGTGETDSTDFDTLDLTDSGDFRVVNETVDADGDSTSGTVEFLDDQGDVSGTLQFTEIEQIIGTPVGLQPPVANDDTAETDEDTPVTIDLRANDTDADNALDDLTISDVTVDPAQGTVINNNDGTVTFTPAADFNGTATLTYTLTDPDGQSDTAQAVVTVNPVNDAPVAVDDADVTDFNTPVTVDLLANDFDIDTDAADLSVVSATVPAEQGTLTENADGTFEFTPVDGFEGEATISYTISDGELEASAIHTVTVGDSQAPEAFDDVATTNEEAPVTIDLRSNDFDPDTATDDLILSDITLVDPTQGELVDNGDGTVTFTPAPEFNGEATITYTVSDPEGNSDTGQAVVTVNPVNDPPVAVDDAATTEEDTAVIVNLTGNDTDPDNTVDELSVVAVSVPAEQGTVENNDDGTVTFTPAANFNGEATITYTVSDPDGQLDEAVAIVTVTPVNDAPEAVDDTDETPFETPVTIDLLANDTDLETPEALTVVSATVAPEEGTLVENADGTFEFTPADGFEGVATVTYTISDGELEDTANHFITVAESTGPEAFDDEATTEEDMPVIVDLRGNDFDPDNTLEELTISEVTVDPAQGTVEDNGDGTVTFTPAPEFSGEVTITYTITDPDGQSDVGQAVVTVTPVNDPPVAVDDTATTEEDTLVNINVLDDDSDPEGDFLTVTEATSPDGTVAILDDGTLDFTPNPDFFGEATINYTITDSNGGFDDAVVLVTVTPVNDAPVAVDDAETTEEDTPVIVDLLGNDSDPDNTLDELTLSDITVDPGRRARLWTMATAR